MQELVIEPTISPVKEKESPPIGMHRLELTKENRREKANVDPYGLRAFGLASLDQVHPAYRDTDAWHPVPAIMKNPKIVEAIRAELYRLENEVVRGSRINLDANGNIVIYAWDSLGEVRAPMAVISNLADRHGLGVLAAKSAFGPTLESESLLRSSGFTMVGASVTLIATGRAGPPNYITFARKPTGAPLFSHAYEENLQKKPTPERRLMRDRSAVR